jgi:hypothetical protein
MIDGSIFVDRSRYAANFVMERLFYVEKLTFGIGAKQQSIDGLDGIPKNLAINPV